MFLESISQSAGDNSPNKLLKISISKHFLSILSLSFFPLLSTLCSIILQMSKSNSALCLLFRASCGISVIRSSMRTLTFAILASFQSPLAGFKKLNVDIIDNTKIIIYPMRVHEISHVNVGNVEALTFAVAFKNNALLAVDV